MNFIKLSALFIISFLCIKILSAQENSNNIIENNTINLYLDCYSCDFDYIRDNITYVNYVRDRKEADVHLLITSNSTGSGGKEFTLFFIGQGKYSNHNDTLITTVPPKSTDDEIRQKLLKFIKLGLVTYVSKTPLVENLNVNYAILNTGETPVDKWDSWVFVINSDGYFNGNDTYKYSYLNNYFNIDRITEKSKREIYVGMNFNRSVYNLEDTTIISLNRSNSFDYNEVFSISDHWSAGGSVGAYTSDYSNIKISSSIGAGIEYNLFKYSESTRRQFRIKYIIGSNYSEYNDTTVYNKIKEFLYEHNLSGAFKIKEKWGTINSSIIYSNYLHDFSLNNLNVNLSFSINLVKNLSLYLYGSYSFIHDQISLPKEGATAEEILTHIRQIKTQYSYYVSLGLSYSFGSIYNNVVNPRFGN